MSLHNAPGKKIVFIVPYPHDLAPGQRFRYEQYLDLLREHGHKVSLRPFLDVATYSILYRRGKTLLKVVGILKGFFRRISSLVDALQADFVFIFREADPIGPPVFEWIIAKVLRKKIIYDFDDAIWTTDVINEGGLEKLIRWRKKVRSICRWSYRVSCGNEYLCSYARNYNSDVVLNPTTIDTRKLHDSKQLPPGQKEKITIGWTGSHSTLKYLNDVVDAISILEKKYPIRFLVIANQKPDLPLRSLEFAPWTKETEISVLREIDIGIMPLPDDEWSKGKCGFKILQYMALDIPSVASPVGVNSTIIQNDVNGYLCINTESWVSTLEALLTNADLRQRIGKCGRETVEATYSVSANSGNFLSLFS